jgi:four helix bundle protein
MEEQKKIYDLLERTEKFSLRVRDFCLKLKRDTINIEYIRQLVRAAGSVAANYIEANENLGDGDLKYRIKVCRKESKESKLWLKHVLTCGDVVLEKERAELIQEAFELENIFGAILKKLIYKEDLKMKSKQ